MSDERDERDAFACDHLPAQQNWACVLKTGERKAAPTLASFSVGRTVYEKYKELREVQRNSPSRRQRPRRHSIAEYRGGNGTAEATVSRSIEWIVGNNVVAAGGRGGEYRGLHDPEISCSHASPGVWRAEPGDPDLIAG